MADNYHLWRQYPTAPFMRFACTVQRDENTEDGFRIVDYDENVADVHFLHTVHLTLRSNHPIRFNDDEGDTIREGIVYAGPEHPEHFATAIRMVPDAYLRPMGRPA